LCDNVDFIAVRQTVAIGIHLVRVGSRLEFLKISKAVPVGVFERQIRVRRIEAVRDCPGIRNSTVGRSCHSYVDSGDAGRAIIGCLDDDCAA